MERMSDNRTGIAAAVAGAVALIVALAVIFDLGPCADEPTVGEFLAEGDEICAAAHDEFRDLQSGSPRTPREARDLTEALIEVAQEERDAIADLGTPEELRSKVNRYLAARDRGIDLMREGLKAAAEADAHAYEAVQAELAATQPDRYAIARAVGFEECSQPLVPRDELERQARPPASTDPSAPPVVNNPPAGG